MTAVLAANVSAGIDAGTHVCALYGSDLERQELLHAYFQGRPSERLVYVGDTADVAGVADIDVRAPNDVYLASGTFRPADVLRSFGGEIHDAIAQGHRRLRVAADMSWATTADPCALVRYESEATDLYRHDTATGMCMYDRRRFTDAHLEALCAAHPFTSDTAERVTPAAFTAWQDADGALRLLGEIDYFGASHLVALVNDRPDLGDDVVIDLSGVRFMDASVLHALQAAATALAAPRRLVLRSPSRMVSRLLDLLQPGGTRALVVRDEVLPAT